MPSLGITGGIATGKSSFTAALLRYLPATVFDADQSAHELLAEDAGVREAVLLAFGPDAYPGGGSPDRIWLRNAVFSNAVQRARLEAILHPLIRARWTKRAAQAASEGDWFCVDLPLLFETDAARHFDHVAVVACSAKTQQRRLREKRGLTDEVSSKITASQIDLGTKIAKAQHLIWNDSTPSCLDRQAGLFAGWLRQPYG